MGNYFSSFSSKKTLSQVKQSDIDQPKSKKRKINDIHLENDSDLSNSIKIILNYKQNNESDSSHLSLESNKSNTNLFNIDSIKQELITPNRKKMKSTSNYIYKTLFLNGENSDIVVKALNKEWLLHKLYLCQSPYFDSMFKGSKWKESSQTCIEISIPDHNINERSLFISFGSFYKEDIEIIPVEVISVLACASLFSLDGLIKQCEQIMLENMNSQSVLAYYDASVIYGVNRVTDKALKWLCQNLMVNEELKIDALSFSLFQKVLSMNDLIIIQVETDLYSLCKKWLYFNLNEKLISSQKDGKSNQKLANEYFKNLISKKYSNDPKICLLNDPYYKKYASIFRKIRFQHIMSDLPSLKLLYNDRIIPPEWIEPNYSRNWFNLLFIDQDRLSNEFEIELNDFEKECLRFGRVLNDEQPATWRWVGFNYGIDLLVTHAARTLTLKRNTINMHSPYRGLLSNKALLRIYYILKLVELDSNGNEVWSKRSDLTCLDLNRSEEKYVFTIEQKVKYPILLNLLISTHPFNTNINFKINETSLFNDTQNTLNN